MGKLAGEIFSKPDPVIGGQLAVGGKRSSWCLFRSLRDRPLPAANCQLYNPFTMEHEENFTHSDSLTVIQAMINKAKDQFSENGHLYLLWGWVILLCSVGHFILIKLFESPNASLIWLLTWAAIIYQTYYLWKQGKRKRVRTYTEDIMGWVWITFVILMFLFGFMFARALGSQYYQFMNVGFLALYGMPTFLSGITLRFRPLIFGGIACWALSIIASFIRSDYHLLLLALAVVIAWIIPGYILRTRFKKINS